MPKPTFDNLPADKRQRILDVALAEFAEHPYALASVTQIAERAGIAKGSIYQYFADKQDLFLFLVEHAARRQLDLLAALAPPAPDLDTFALLGRQMRASVQVGLALPVHTRLMQRAFADDIPFRDEVARRTQAVGAGHLQAIVRRGVERGEIDPAFAGELGVFLIQAVVGELRGLILRRLGLAPHEASADLARLAGPEVEAIYETVLRFFAGGLRRKDAASQE